MNRKIGMAVLAIFWIVQTGFAQNTLEYYLNAARANNPAIKQSLSLKEKADLQKKIIKSEYQGPKVYASGDLNYSPLLPNKDDSKAIGYDVAITDGGLIAANLNVLQPVFNRQVRETLVKQAQSTGEAGVVQASLSLHQLEKEVTDQYILAWQNLSQIEFISAIKNQLQKQKEVVETMAKSGLYKTSDVLLIDIEIRNQEALLNNLQSAYLQNLSNLNSQCGLANETSVKLLRPTIGLRDSNPMSKFLEKFRSDSLQEVLNLDVSNLKYKPQFNLYGNAGLKAIEFEGIQRKFGAAVGLALSIPIYDGHQKEYTRQQSEINLQDIDNYKQNFLIQKNNRQNALVSALDFLEKKMTVIHSQLTDYEKLIELYQTELKAGTLEIINYMNTIRLYTTLENELSMNETNKFLIINESNYYNW